METMEAEGCPGVAWLRPAADVNVTNHKHHGGGQQNVPQETVRTAAASQRAALDKGAQRNVTPR